MDMQRILTSLTALRNQLVEDAAARQRGEPVDLVRAARIDLLNTAILALHHYAAPDAKILEALSL